MIIGITGLAGAGKDTVAATLVNEHGFVRVSLADPIKRACAEWFGWSADALWGPSELRAAPDPAWGGLTPRYALQQLGTEFGRRMHPDVWVRAALRDAAALLAGSADGTPSPAGVVIPDVRFDNEATAIRAAGGRIVRVVRPGSGLVGDAGAHASEAGVAVDLVDVTVLNDRGLDWLAACARRLV